MIKKKFLISTLFLIILIFILNQTFLTHRNNLRFRKLSQTDIESEQQAEIAPIIPKKENKNNYLIRYPFLSKCDIEYKSSTEYNQPIDQELHEKRIIRAVMFYFPLKRQSHFMRELRWVYRSWIEMQKYEPTKWRTDLLVFVDNNKIAEDYKNFEELNCSFKNIRTSNTDAPMCSLVAHIPINDRSLIESTLKFSSTIEEYLYLYRDLDIFDENEANLINFYKKIQSLSHYGYVDSILMAFDGYTYLKNKYQYVVRSDMDVFLTPLFSKWLPKNCNDFVVGGGAYSNDFNIKKLGRIANNLKLEYSGIRNLGSTWFASPAQFRLVSYLTLVSMAYISNEEFTSIERKGQIGTLNWPEWHYGVLLLYGQNLALNHLIATNQTNVMKYADIIDYGSGSERDIFKSVHIHVYHGRAIFSKFDFYDGKYENMSVPAEYLNKTNYYCLHMALESKRLNSSKLVDHALAEAFKKT